MKKLFEGFGVGDLVSVLEPKIHIDEFSSKIGKDADIIVLSFLVNDRQAAIDIVDFFETGYDFILDADISSSEIKPGSYLVFVEILRRRRNIDQFFTLIGDLSAASGLNKKDWKFRYINGPKYFPLTAEEIKRRVPLTPRSYREHVSQPIEEMKHLSGLPVYESFRRDNDIETLMHRAGIDSIRR